MLDDDQGHPAGGQLRDHPGDLVHLVAPEAGKRLVEEQNGGPGHDGAPDLEALQAPVR